MPLRATTMSDILLIFLLTICTLQFIIISYYIALQTRSNINHTRTCQCEQTNNMYIQNATLSTISTFNTTSSLEQNLTRTHHAQVAPVLLVAPPLSINMTHVNPPASIDGVAVTFMLGITWGKSNIVYILYIIYMCA